LEKIYYVASAIVAIIMIVKFLFNPATNFHNRTKIEFTLSKMGKKPNNGRYKLAYDYKLADELKLDTDEINKLCMKSAYLAPPVRHKINKGKYRWRVKNDNKLSFFKRYYAKLCFQKLLCNINVSSLE